MQKKRIIIGFICLICIGIGIQFFQKKPSNIIEENKLDFYIETMTLGKQGGDVIISKNGKVEGISDIVLSAQTAGRIISINKKIGDNVQKGINIINIEDTQGSASYRVAGASLAINSAKNTYEIQKKNIEKQIQDLLLAKERAELNYSNTAGKENNNTLLQLEGLQKSLEKARLDYETKLGSDNITLQNNTISAKNIYNDTLNLLLDVVDQSDKLLGVTDLNRRIASDYDIYLGGRNTDIRKKAEDELRNLFAKKTELQELGNDITLENIHNYLEKYKIIVLLINDFTISMKDVFINSLEDVRYLPKSKLDGYIASFGILQSKSSGIIASITLQSNSLRLFVDSYKANQESLKKQIEILENDIIIRETQIEEVAKNSEINLKGAEGNYNYIIDTKDLNLETINNNLQAAQIALGEAQFNIEKFSIKAPIVGIISDIMVDVGQEVNIGTPILKLVSEGKGIKLSMSEKEIKGIQVGKNVIIKNNQIEGNGLVISVGVIADKNGNFPIEIYIENGNFTIGTYVDVTIPASRGTSMIPLNSVSIIDNNIGQIILWDGNELLTKQINLGLVFGQFIEVKDVLDDNMVLVLSDTKIFDKEKMIIKVK